MWLHSRMIEDRLNGLAFIHIYREVFIDIVKIIDMQKIRIEELILICNL